MEISKDEFISKIYYDIDDGFQSINQTYKDAKLKDSSITLDDVKNWFKQNTIKKNKPHGYNSFIAPYPYYEYQLDLLFFNDLSKEAGVKQKLGMICIDIFSRYITVAEIDSKTPKDILDGLKQCIADQQCKPEIIFTDQEGSFLSKVVQSYLKEHDIKHLVTRSHPAYAERAIRTIKNMVYKRVEANENNN